MYCSVIRKVFSNIRKKAFSLLPMIIIYLTYLAVGSLGSEIRYVLTMTVLECKHKFLFYLSMAEVICGFVLFCIRSVIF